MSVFGFKDQAEFEKAVEAEMEQINSHAWREGGLRPGQQKPKAQARKARQPDTKTPYVGDRPIRGKVGSPEREAAIRAINPELYDQAKAEQAARQISMLLNSWSQSE